MERDLLQKQQIEAELIATRLFRFRARRGQGVFYSLISILPLEGVILVYTIPILTAIATLLVSYLAIWFVARLGGFGGLSRMQYSLDFLKGQKGSVYDDDKERWKSWARNFAWFIINVWPWFGYTIANAEGYRVYAGIFIAILIAQMGLIRIFSSSSESRNRILERRVEDWGIAAGAFSIAVAALLPGFPPWTWVIATPIFLVCGTKSLYDAPKELALVDF